MSDRPTPESDETHRLNWLPSTTEEVAYRTILNLSRRLERERDEAREAAEKAKAFKRMLKEENTRLRRELEAWKEARK